MGSHSFTTNLKFILITFVVIFIVLMACARSIGPASAPWNVSGQPARTAGATQDASVSEGSARMPGEPVSSPTPDPPHPLPTLRVEPERYTVQSGDTLGQIAQRFSVSLQKLVLENALSNPNLLEIGQILAIPPPDPGAPGPAFKIIPDSELVYGPASVGFDIARFVQEQGGYLATYWEEVENVTLSGVQVVERIAYEYSLNPRLLLALLEYQSGWVTKDRPEESTLEYPVGVQDMRRKGLYRQLAWAANYLNLGYYLWRVNGIGAWITFSGEMVPIDPTINAGTAGVQHMFSLMFDRPTWESAVSEQGLFTVYNTFFGNPFERAVEPLLPPGLSQPPLQLPFEDSKVWAFTGGPHGGWGSGSAWAALDFAPHTRPLGCTQSDEWVVAVADGVIVRADNGAVVQDLHGDGLEQTGWTVLYMHIETRDRVQPGVYLRAGERIGHASCEGGVSSGTHLHLARRYNGEWIPADQTIPFVLDGWVSRGAGREYNGFLQREGQSIEAYEGRSPINEIQR